MIDIGNLDSVFYGIDFMELCNGVCRSSCSKGKEPIDLAIDIIELLGLLENGECIDGFVDEVKSFLINSGSGQSYVILRGLTQERPDFDSWERGDIDFHQEDNIWKKWLKDRRPVLDDKLMPVVDAAEPGVLYRLAFRKFEELGVGGSGAFIGCVLFAAKAIDVESDVKLCLAALKVGLKRKFGIEEKPTVLKKSIVRRIEARGKMETDKRYVTDNASKEPISFIGKGVSVTGGSASYSRSWLFEMVEKAGGVAQNSVTQKTSYLVICDKASKGYAFGNAGRKMEAAERLGVVCITEYDFICALRDAGVIECTDEELDDDGPAPKVYKIKD